MGVREDLDHLRNPDGWTHFNVCPIKRWKDGQLECGIVWAGELTSVYEKNLFLLASGALTPQLEGCRKFAYASIEEMLADGWVVD